MPITQSAKKALRQNLRRYARNLTVKRGVKQEIKQLKKLIAQKKIDEARAHLATVYQKLDKSAKVHVLKKNTASRLKSRLTRLVNKTFSVKN